MDRRTGCGAASAQWQGIQISNYVAWMELKEWRILIPGQKRGLTAGIRGGRESLFIKQVQLTFNQKNFSTCSTVRILWDSEAIN